MENLSRIAIDLLCSLTFQPSGGHDPEDLASLEQDAWQTLIHGLSSEELAAVRSYVQTVVEELQERSDDEMPEHLESQLSVLQQYLDGELE